MTTTRIFSIGSVLFSGNDFVPVSSVVIGLQAVNRKRMAMIGRKSFLVNMDLLFGAKVPKSRTYSDCYEDRAPISNFETIGWSDVARKCIIFGLAIEP